MTEPASAMGAILNQAPPDYSADQVADLAQAHFGLTGPLRRLTSERDLNYHLTTPQGDYVVKIANLAEDRAVTRFQNRALLHIAARDAALPVPRVVPARDGATDVVLPQGHILRVLTYLQGVPLYAAPRSAAQADDLARVLARLGRALADFNDRAADHVLQWDIKHAARLRPLLPKIGDAGLRDLCDRALTRFETHVAPLLPALRWQVVHADLNPHNVLVQADAPDRVSGILDFGDMVRTPLVCDLAVAASYQIDPAAPLESLMRFAAAYAAEYPLTRAELQVLPDLVAARMVTTVAITATRAALQPENAAYILRNVPVSQAGLAALAGLPAALIETALLPLSKETA